MKWKYCRIDQIGTVSRGKSRHRPRDATHLYGGPYPFIQTGDVKASGLYITEYSQTYSDAGLAQSKLWPAGTLCITIAANIGDTSILAFDACFPDSVIGFVADQQKADTRFIKYLFDSKLKAQYKAFSQGVAQDNLSQEKLLSIDLKIPDVTIQTRIADILSAYDDLIENNRRQIKLLEESARLLYREWFVRLRFPGHEQVKVVDGVPEGWERKTAYDFIDVQSGGTPKTTNPEYWDGGIPFFTPKDAGDAYYVLETEKNLTEIGLQNCNSKLYPANTVFITARGTVGKIRIAQRPMAMNQSCYALVGKPGISQLFLYLSIVASVEEFKARANGAVFDAIIVDTFKSIPFLKPSEDLVLDFESSVKPIFESISNMLIQNQKLTAARDLLLPRLMSGELEV